MRVRCVCLGLLLSVCSAARVAAQERPFFVTYDHYLEEPRSLEIAVASTTGIPKNDKRVYTAPWVEFEYGVKGWWTTELYLEGVTTRGDGNGMTGWRWENRFRPLQNEHRVNPVLYIEYENITEASRIQKEIVGAGPLPYEPIAELKEEHAHEIEGKLILSSAIRAWTVAENLIIEKNLSEDEGFEFGYAVGVSRSLRSLASGRPCRFCAENVRLGVEAYGGLGSTEAFERSEQRHYVAPGVSWRLGPQASLKASLALGLTRASDRALVRFGFAYEFPMGGR